MRKPTRGLALRQSSLTSRVCEVRKEEPADDAEASATLENVVEEKEDDDEEEDNDDEVEKRLFDDIVCPSRLSRRGMDLENPDCRLLNCVFPPPWPPRVTT